MHVQQGFFLIGYSNLKQIFDRNFLDKPLINRVAMLLLQNLNDSFFRVQLLIRCARCIMVIVVVKKSTTRI